MNSRYREIKKKRCNANNRQSETSYHVPLSFEIANLNLVGHGFADHSAHAHHHRNITPNRCSLPNLRCVSATRLIASTPHYKEPAVRGLFA